MLGSLLKWLFGLSMLYLVGVLAYVGYTASPKTAEELQCGTEFEASVMAQVFVKKRLVSPTTAEFPWSEKETKVVSRPDCKWIVSGYLDSQNEFGAMIRSDYIAEMSKTPNEDRWIADKISIFP